MQASDKNGDRLLDKEEVTGLVQPHFAHFDVNQDGLLSAPELMAVADWLNHHHQPGVPVAR